jgi:hypothetical protein
LPSEASFCIAKVRLLPQADAESLISGHPGWMSAPDPKQTFVNNQFPAFRGLLIGHNPVDQSSIWMIAGIREASSI